jgi:hypothetical protein
VPRTAGARSNTTRGRRGARRGDDGAILTQITNLVAAVETLRRENQRLTEDNERLRAQLAEIGSALGRSAGGRRGRGAAAAVAPDGAPRQRRPITDPDALERRRAALVKARAARAEKLAAAREGVTSA